MRPFDVQWWLPAPRSGTVPACLARWITAWIGVDQVGAPIRARCFAGLGSGAWQRAAAAAAFAAAFATAAPCPRRLITAAAFAAAFGVAPKAALAFFAAAFGASA